MVGTLVMIRLGSILNLMHDLKPTIVNFCLLTVRVRWYGEGTKISKSPLMLINILGWKGSYWKRALFLARRVGWKILTMTWAHLMIG